MSKKSQATAPWASGVRVYGPKGEIVWKLYTGASFTADNLTHYFGVCRSTALSWLGHLIKSKIAYEEAGRPGHFRGHFEACKALCELHNLPPDTDPEKPIKKLRF